MVDLAPTNEIPSKEKVYNDVFLALIAASGTELDTIETNLTEYLETVNYQVLSIRLSKPLKEWKKIDVEDQYELIKQAMDAGDDLREKLGKIDDSPFGGKQAVALLGLKQVIDLRGKTTEKGRAYLFRSLKTPEEVWALRELYGRSFYAISVFSDTEKRSKRLASRLSARANKESDAAYLVSRDETDSSNSFGQNVRDTFPLGNVFINVDQIGPAKKELKRFVELIFGNTFLTPTRSEYCMFHAQGAAFRSADLGRQVGAVISSTDGEILAVGTNEVPKYGGGQFWAEDEKESDPRDFVREHDWNDEKKRELIRDLLMKLTKIQNTPLPMNETSIDALIDGMFSSKPDEAFRGSLVMDIIGFYRSVHAETAAIIDAARRGVSIKNCIMYVTAFPCHECARHILASGISLVRYIEPYPKSLAADQYPDSIEVASAGAVGDKLVFEPFVGIAPWQYMQLFAKNKRKEKNGKVIKFKASNCKLRYGRTLDFFEKVEHNWCDSVSKLVAAGEKEQ